MFGFFKRRLLREMEGYVAAIQLSVYGKLKRSFEEQHGEKAGRRLAAAVVNKLFGKAPTHTESELALAEQLASEIMRSDEEVRYAASMSARAMIVTEFHAKGSDAMWRHVNTIEWIKQFGELPAEPPSPKLIKELAGTLYRKYASAQE